jgi:predicted membrane channel-forming protein YqfA (hemolysin III family)
MADNLSQITEVFNNINTTFEFNSTEIIANAISYGNIQSNNWLGIFIFILLGISLLILINKNRNDFKVNTDMQLILLLLNILLDIGFILYQYRILANIQLVMFLYASFIGICVFSIIKKDTETLS